MNSHLLSLFISYRSSGEKLIKYQTNSSSVIMSVILMTILIDKALISLGEIWCWSLLRLKGLKERGIYSHNCKKLNKTTVIYSKILFKVRKVKTSWGENCLIRKWCFNLFWTFVFLLFYQDGKVIVWDAFTTNKVKKT